MFNNFNSKAPSISMEMAKNNLSNDTSIYLIDVRTPTEYIQGHIPNSINIPLDTAFNIESIVVDKNSKIYVYCQSGNRSNKASKIYRDLGYINTTNIGGIVSWTGKIV
ncbi:rhodanese-like domain-containing protein [Alkalibaculum sp. M08DMB]|uniref:Rhodanese-like domain-containing protein n=1 Tax=Alkalibaculum sporogenes TaxID=2655001 RepID=A0A6A7K4Z8_9FIRM|nr:rhodanese-like domain-containing protein [Alkalibaculum sporogenes]MPW24451.1 rhodanese-like domain-containing protein [Alkalibaculum sporogenes]